MGVFQYQIDQLICYNNVICANTIFKVKKIESEKLELCLCDCDWFPTKSPDTKALFSWFLCRPHSTCYHMLLLEKIKLFHSLNKTLSEEYSYTFGCFPHFVHENFPCWIHTAFFTLINNNGPCDKSLISVILLVNLSVWQSLDNSIQNI